MKNYELKREENLKSLAEPLKNMFTKQKKLTKTYYKTVDLKGPVLELLRRTGKSDFYEKATKGEFEFKHSDGSEKKIILDPMFSFDTTYLNQNVKKYICHEDHAFPLPHTALIAVQTLQNHEDQVLSSVAKFKTELERAKANTLKQWAGIAVLLLLAFVAWLLFYEPGTATQAVAQTIPGNFTLG